MKMAFAIIPSLSRLSKDFTFTFAFSSFFTGVNYQMVGGRNLSNTL